MFRYCFISLCFLLTGCSSTAILSQRGSYLRAYHNGDFVLAEEDLNGLVEKEIPDNNYTKSSEASWILLDRATTRFAMGKVDEAIQDYASAIESLDFYNKDLATEQAAKILLQDEKGAYQADDFEQILARVYFALALIHQGDESNAYALLRQAEEIQQEKRALYSKLPFTRHYSLSDNGLSKYLFALLLEKRGDKGNASILYEEASQLIPPEAFESQKLKHQASVLIICHNGNAPYKVSTTAPASVASAAALEILLAVNHNRPALSTMMGIPVPALRQWPFSNPTPTYAQMDGINKPLLPFYSVSKMATEELKQKIPVIAARGVARLAVRRAAVGYLQRQDPGLGALADLTMCVVNCNTRADTRSWTTLPAFLDVARFNVEPGCHDVQIKIYENCTVPFIKTYKINVESNDLCIIHVFNIHPGITQILIPNRYLAGEFYEE